MTIAKMSRLAIILCVIAFFASGTIANPEPLSEGPFPIIPQRKPVNILPDIIVKAMNDIMNRTKQVLKQILSLDSIEYPEMLRFGLVNVDTVQEHIQRIERTVKGSFPKTTENNRSHKSECRTNLNEHERKLKAVAADVYQSSITEIRALLHEENRQLEHLNGLKTEAQRCKGKKCHEIANISKELRQYYLRFAGQVRDFYVKIWNGSAIIDRFRETYQLDDYFREEQQILEDVRTCARGVQQS